MLLDDAYNFYLDRILRRLAPALVGTNIIAQHVGPLPPGTTQITQEELLALQSEAKIGRPEQPIPRETGDLRRWTVPIPEFAHGFKLNRKVLEATQNTVDFPTAYVDASTRLIQEGLEQMIFNGLPELGIKGIYADAGANGAEPYSVTKGAEWDGSSSEIFNDLVNAAALLEETGVYHPMKLVLGVRAYRAMTRVNEFGLSAAKELVDASDRTFFPNGMGDVYIAPLRYKDSTPFIPADSGLMCDFNPDVGERYIEEQINLRMPMPNGNEDDIIPFNIVTFQSQVIHYPLAYLQLDNLVTVSP